MHSKIFLDVQDCNILNKKKSARRRKVTQVIFSIQIVSFLFTLQNINKILNEFLAYSFFKSFFQIMKTLAILWTFTEPWSFFSEVYLLTVVENSKVIFWILGNYLRLSNSLIFLKSYLRSKLQMSFVTYLNSLEAFLR